MQEKYPGLSFKKNLSDAWRRNRITTTTTSTILLIFSSFFASYDAMNGYRGDQNVGRKLSTVDENDNLRRLPSP